MGEGAAIGVDSGHDCVGVCLVLGRPPTKTRGLLWKVPRSRGCDGLCGKALDALNDDVFNNEEILKVLSEFDRIIQAIASGKISSLERIVERHPSIVNTRNVYGVSPIVFAVKEGDTLAVQALIDAGAKVNESHDLLSPVSGRLDSGVLPLMFAASIPMVDLLVSRGAQAFLTDSYGRTCIDRLAIDDPNLAKYLLELVSREQ